MSNNPYFNAKSYDFIEKTDNDGTPMLLRSKDESAPSYVFSTYWLNYWSHTNNSHR
jgi:hypothetical protein